VTGGVSVGDHDHTRAAAEQAGVQTVFHRVRQKPGKPLYFGTRDRKPVFGLPGNPSSVLTCFYMYVLPCLGAMTGRNLAMRREQHPIAADYKKPAGITHFLKGRTLGDEATVSTAQESYKLSSFALANVFIMIPEELEYVAKGTSVDVFYMP
jgi:molybdopterin molybdotransferase